MTSARAPPSRERVVVPDRAAGFAERAPIVIRAWRVQPQPPRRARRRPPPSSSACCCLLLLAAAAACCCLLLLLAFAAVVSGGVERRAESEPPFRSPAILADTQ